MTKSKKLMQSISTQSMQILMGSAMLTMIISCGGCFGSKMIQSPESKTSKGDNYGIESSTTKKVRANTELELGILNNAPRLPLEDADITEVYDHYILQDTANNQKYHFYDGSKQQTLDFSGPDVHIQVSRNGKYLSKMKLVQNKMSNQYFLDVEIRDASNKILGKQSIPSAYQDYYDEFRDEIIPLEDGSGFIQIGRRLGLSCFVTGYKLVGNKLIKKFQINKPENFLYDIKSNADGSKIALVYESDHHENTKKYTLGLYNIDKGLLWEKPIPKKYYFTHQWDFNKTFLNKEDLYLFENGIDTGRVIRYNFEGKIMDNIHVSGNFHHWDFLDSTEGEMLLIYSKEFLYIYKTNSKEVSKIDLFGILKLKGNATIWIRNAIFTKSIDNTTDNLIFVLEIDAYPKDKTFFTGVLCYSINAKTLKAFKSTPFYGKLTKRDSAIFLQKHVSSYFQEKIPKLDLNIIK